MRSETLRMPLFVIVATLCLLLTSMWMTNGAKAQVKIDANIFGGLEARSIGSAAPSGRIRAIDAVTADPNIIYVGAASGGVWKSTNGGTTFKPVFDKYIQSIGAVTIDQAHPETVWVGT